MKNILKKYAESFCSSMDDWSDEEVVKTVDLFRGQWMEAVCDRARLIANVRRVEEDTEWNNIACRLIYVALSKEISEGRDLHLVMKISRIAPVAVTYWLNYEPWLIDKNLAVPAGMPFSGRLGSEALKVRKQILDLLHLRGFFVVPRIEFEFEVKIGAGEESARRSISGGTFFFGSKI
ncbi:hypothetical protein [Pedosphaera parvula]|uniref:Uncharacterized protein n=1 Tax=Pedosphaera parvula (strain Ellin514) TaxID=320771 RepID=B9XBP3_PEDPL|nr:hypothetical protein [Pedosphaera parvula]EEF62928.1 hypothetical protein Cflav_PD5563 [Pedosphaera parvula Ellin514]